MYSFYDFVFNPVADNFSFVRIRHMRLLEFPRVMEIKKESKIGISWHSATGLKKKQSSYRQIVLRDSNQWSKYLEVVQYD